MEIAEHHVLESKLETAHHSSVWRVCIAIFLSIVSYGIGYAVQFLLARILGIKLYGAYAAASGSIAMLATFSLVGVGYGLNKFLPGFIAKNNLPSAAGFLRYTSQRIGVINTILFICGLITTFVIFHLNSLHVLDIRKVHPFYLFLWSIPIITLINWATSFLKSTGNGLLSLSMTGVIRPLVMLLLFGILLLLKVSFTIQIVFFSYLSATLLTLLVAIITITRKTPMSRIVKTSPAYDGPNWSKEVIQLFIFATSVAFFGTFAIIFSAIFDKNSHAAGIVAASITMANTMWVLVGAINTIMIPKLSAKIAAEDLLGVRKHFMTSVIMAIIFCVPTFIGLCLFGKQWLAHFGAGFAEGYPALMIIASSILINVLLSPIQWVVQYSKNIRDLVKISVTLFIIFIVIEPILIYFWGVMGCAIGYAVIHVIYCISMVWLGVKDDKFLFDRTTATTANL